MIFAGCDDPSTDLQTRLTYAQKELDVANAEVQKLRAELDKPKEQGGEVARPAVSEEGFREAAKNFAGQLEAELKGATVGDFTYSDVKPLATFHFMLTMADGTRTGREVLAAATPDGRWVFPAAGEFARGLVAVANREMPNVSPATRVAEAPVQEQARPQAGNPGGPAAETKDVNWGDKPRQPAGLRNPIVPVPQQPPVPRLAQPPPPNPRLPPAHEEKSVSFEKK